MMVSAQIHTYRTGVFHPPNTSPCCCTMYTSRETLLKKLFGCLDEQYLSSGAPDIVPKRKGVCALSHDQPPSFLERNLLLFCGSWSSLTTLRPTSTPSPQITVPVLRHLNFTNVFSLHSAASPNLTVACRYSRLLRSVLHGRH